MGTHGVVTGGVCINVVLLSLCLSLAGPILAQDNSARPAQDDAESRKLEAVLAFLRKRNAQDYAITTPNGIDEARYVAIGGIEQWITIRGEDRNNPVLLLLHGGPGDATNPWGYAGFRSWLKVFTVVQWDQRGAGRTFGKSGPSSAPTITIERMTQDGIELAELAPQDAAEGQDHHRRSLLGLDPGRLHGEGAAGPLPCIRRYRAGRGPRQKLRRGLRRACSRRRRRLGEQRAIRELKEIGRPPYADGRGYRIQRRWSNLFEGADAFISSMFGFALAAPGYSLRDVNDWLDGQMLSGERLVPQTSALTATALGGEFAVPVFVIQGAEDFTTPTSLARSFVEFDPCAAQGVRPHRGRRPLRRVHEAGCLSERARRASAAAGEVVVDVRGGS